MPVLIQNHDLMKQFQSINAADLLASTFPTIPSTALPGAKRGHEHIQDERNESKEQSENHARSKKRKLRHPPSSTWVHPSVASAAEETTTAALSCGCTTQIRQDEPRAIQTVEHESTSSPSAPVWSPITPLLQLSLITRDLSAPNPSLQPPPGSPIVTPSQSKPPPLTEAEILRDRIAFSGPMLKDMDGEGTHQTILGRDEQLHRLGSGGPCQLPGLRKLGLDVLYGGEQIVFFKCREKSVERDEGEGGAENERDGERDGRREIEEGSRDFWSVVM